MPVQMIEPVCRHLFYAWDDDDDYYCYRRVEPKHNFFGLGESLSLSPSFNHSNTQKNAKHYILVHMNEEEEEEGAKLYSFKCYLTDHYTLAIN